MKKSLVILASVLLLIGAGCEKSLEDATRSASETQETDDNDQRDGGSSDDVKKEDDSKLEDGDDTKRGEVENESEDEDEKESDDDDRVTPAPTPTPSTGASDSLKTYSMSEVAVHKNATSCWSVVNGSVYDLTTWIGKHPGGAVAISLLCGRDGSKDFNEQHGGSAPQESRLATFKIGVLK
ncbi:MAG: cytochrome b5-like heme/steroid binding domain-containing protein [Patescibacteria group bacterium]|jgi:cytochrome b involved in lipid metabolism